MLPTITFGGQEFYDISGIVVPDSSMGGIRPATDGIAFHHTVGQTEFPDKNANGTSLDEMEAHIRAINAFHIRQGYGGFGYNAIAFRDGTVCVVGKAAGKRAHVAHQNWHLGGIAGAGDFSNRDVPVGISLGVARFAVAMEREYGVTRIDGHQNWVAPEHRPQWSTACPGTRGLHALGQIGLSRDAIIRKDNEAVEAVIRANIAAALREASESGDVEKLAGQIKWITGGRLC